MLVLELLVSLEVTKIQFHLSPEPGFELADLQVDGDHGAKPSMKEQQVNVVVAPIDRDPLLSSHEREVGAELDQCLLMFGKNRCLKIPFAVVVLESEKVENVGVAKGEIGREAALIA